jgi:hypothetical protein
MGARENEHGCLLVDQNNRTYSIKIDISTPKSILFGILMGDLEKPKEMISTAYKERKNIVIGDSNLDFWDYEELFLDCDFYIPPEKAAVINF